jgi:hypothetical protein
MDTPKWEYKAIKIKANKGFLGGKIDERDMIVQFNELGLLGWELVSTFVTQEGYGSSKDLVAVFKKVKIR